MCVVYRLTMQTQDSAQDVDFHRQRKAIWEVEGWEKRKNEALNELTNPQFIKFFMGMQRGD